MCILYINKSGKKIWEIFPKYEFQKLLSIKRHPKMMSCYQGGILNTWNDFKISQNRQYIVSSGFSITNSKEYTDFYSVFSIQKKIWKKKSDIFSENLSFKNYCQLSDIPKSCHFIRAVYWTPEMIFKSRKIGNILFHQVFQKQILRNTLICIVYFIYKQIWKKNLRNFPKIWVSEIIVH